MQLLGALRAGPTLAVMGLAVVFGLPDRRRTVPALLGSLVLAFAVFWFATGQGIGNLGDYAINTANVVSGYSRIDGLSPARSLVANAGGDRRHGHAWRALRGRWMAMGQRQTGGAGGPGGGGHLPHVQARDRARISRHIGVLLGALLAIGLALVRT